MLYFCYSYSISSWDQTDVLYWKQEIPMFVTVLSIVIFTKIEPLLHEHLSMNTLVQQNRFIGSNFHENRTPSFTNICPWIHWYSKTVLSVVIFTKIEPHLHEHLSMNKLVQHNHTLQATNYSTYETIAIPLILQTENNNTRSTASRHSFKFKGNHWVLENRR